MSSAFICHLKKVGGEEFARGEHFAGEDNTLEGANKSVVGGNPVPGSGIGGECQYARRGAGGIRPRGRQERPVLACLPCLSIGRVPSPFGLFGSLVLTGMNNLSWVAHGMLDNVKRCASYKVWTSLLL